MIGQGNPAFAKCYKQKQEKQFINKVLNQHSFQYTSCFFTTRTHNGLRKHLKTTQGLSKEQHIPI